MGIGEDSERFRAESQASEKGYSLQEGLVGQSRHGGAALPVLDHPSLGRADDLHRPIEK